MFYNLTFIWFIWTSTGSSGEYCHFVPCNFQYRFCFHLQSELVSQSYLSSSPKIIFKINFLANILITWDIRKRIYGSTHDNSNYTFFKRFSTKKSKFQQQKIKNRSYFFLYFFLNFLDPNWFWLAGRHLYQSYTRILFKTAFCREIQHILKRSFFKLIVFFVKSVTM